MPNPVINFVWVGPPKLTEGGQDVCGPESIALNFKEFADESTQNPMVFWCQKQYKSVYEAYFLEKGIDIQVSPIDDYLQNRSEKCSNNCEEEAKVVLKHYTEEILDNRRAQTSDYVGMKDMFFNFLLATQGGYVLDTNIQAIGSIPVQLSARDQFSFPILELNTPGRSDRTTYEVWMQYAPADNLVQPKKCLAAYLKHLEMHPRAKIGIRAVHALFVCEQDLSTPWMLIHDDSANVVIQSMGIVKEYCNTHTDVCRI